MLRCIHLSGLSGNLISLRQQQSLLKIQWLCNSLISRQEGRSLMNYSINDKSKMLDGAYFCSILWLACKGQKTTETLLWSAASFYPTQSDNFLIFIHSCKCKYFQGLPRYDVDITTTAKDINKKPSKVQQHDWDECVSEMKELFRKRMSVCPYVQHPSIRIAAEASLPLGIYAQTDRQTTWPGEQRRGKRAVSLGQQQLQQQQLQQSWYNRVIEQLFPNSHGVETTIPFSTLLRS